MTATTLKGMTWDHRRAIDPLVAATDVYVAQNPHISIKWDKRPLAGFEFTSVDALAESYDLIVLDHPFSGEIAASGSLCPVDEIVAGIDERFVGCAVESYRMDGHVWAVPIDAATQLQAVRPDLLDRLGYPVPTTWAAVEAIGAAAAGHGLSLAIALRGVHSLMTFYSLCANMGAPCGQHPDEPFCDRAVATEALDRMQALLALCPPAVLDWNAIQVLDAMFERDDLVLCPAVYCYATYAEADYRHPLRFHDFAGPRGAAGSTVGGTGLGVSARRNAAEAALDFARFAAGADIQMLFADHHGQPARVEAWDDAGLDTRFGGCFANTRKTQDQTWIRPRYKGYLAFQAVAGDRIEAFLRGGLAMGALLDELSALHTSGAQPVASV